MKSIRNARLLQISGLLLSVLVWLANSNNPTNGRTGAPFDQHCNVCHGGNNPSGFAGTVDISGMPAVVQPNIVYPLTLTMTPTAGSPARGGFQLVAVDGNNVNAGNLAVVNTQCGTETASSGREYIEHRGAKNFTGGGPASWTFNWTAPGTANGNQIKFYYIGNFTNGSGSGGDYPVAFLNTYTFSGPSDPLVASISSFSNVTCNGGNNGSITVTATGGTAPYTYAWSNGQTTPTAVNLAAGTYTVTVTGASGSGTATASRTITQPAGMTVTVNNSGPLTCAQTSATISASVQGGAQPYTYHWINGANTSQTTVNQAGTYGVTVTDINGCTKTASGAVTANTTPPTISFGAPPTLTCSTTSVTLNTSGSSGANFTNSWVASNGGNIVSGATTLNPVVNACGTYTLVITNTTNGCTTSASRTVTCNTAPPPVIVTGGALTCNTTTVTISASSISGATYQWSGPCINASNMNQQNPVVCDPGAYTVTVTNPATGCTATATTQVTENVSTPVVTIGNVAEITCNNPTVPIPTNTPTNVTYSWAGPCIVPGTEQLPTPTVCIPGLYTVVVTNPTTGCTGTASVAVIDNYTVPLAAVATPAQLNCNAASVPLDASASSQGAGFTYQWSTTDGNIVSGSNSLAPVVDMPGTYRLIVTNLGNGCSAEATTTVSQSTPLTSIATATATSCSGDANGSATVTATGGTGTYIYLWSNGNTNATASDLQVGIYSVTATDSEGCSSISTATITEPTALQITVITTAQTALNLSDGTATASVSGGTPGYTYAWSNEGTTATISGLAPGAYFVTATDANGCSAVQIGNVNTFNCNLNGAITSVDVSCNGAANGSASVQITGAIQPVTYLWTNFVTTAAISNLSPAPYLVSVTDGAGCSLILGVEIEEPTELTLLSSATSETAIGAGDGTASVQPSGGTPVYTYLWDNNATTASIGNLASGSYTVTVRDANGCSEMQTVVVPSISCALEAEMVVTPVKCLGTATGTATVAVTGGGGTLSYQWSNNATTEIVENLPAGPVTVVVTDEVGCSVTGSATIESPETELVASAGNINHVTCPLDQTGSATPVISGGWGAPFTFQFSWGLGGFNNLPVGDYSFTVTDTKGCAVVATFEIEARDSIAPTLFCPDNYVLCGADLLDFPATILTDNCPDNTIEAVLTGGLPSGSAFLDGVTTQIFSATDAAGNTGTCSFTVTVYPISDIVINDITNDVNSSGAGSIDIAPVGDSGPYTFDWEKDGAFFADTEDLDGLNTGTYTLIMTDANGCTVQLSPIVIENLVGTADPAAAHAKITLWPNPAHDAFRLEMVGIEPVAMEILNAQGQLVRTLEPAEWNGEISVDALPSGFYYLKMVSRRGAVQVMKWVKAEG